MSLTEILIGFPHWDCVEGHVKIVCRRETIGFLGKDAEKDLTHDAQGWTLGCCIVGEIETINNPGERLLRLTDQSMTIFVIWGHSECTLTLWECCGMERPLRRVTVCLALAVPFGGGGNGFELTIEDLSDMCCLG
ncbi:hypothetical protein Ddc_18706 [Ditylenchus destructor]|nr:hypothetical protein Ddc_18706 [Ditylenchus destructor]